ncbi:hypothetical protein CCAX7_004800 [Capsulimonas corticalis]|uniref:Uncharacterized protein n=1 Tax=Capsulimonas corticalis TaxID=2219043 RepID=A0A402D2S4_9BACT|nr:hypothetical protein [Capsulimonas corticalis]BDI28429.1 hypothetical protein CCAX7_004800 [Capsulimonas corticalis]
MSKSRTLPTLAAALCLAALPLSAVHAKTAHSQGAHGDAQFEYHGQAFTQFLVDSYTENNQTNPRQFYAWFDQATKPFLGSSATLEAALNEKRAELARVSDPQAKAAKEMEIGAWTHKLVKKSIPKFSLDRGYDFTNTVAHGERQCFLQSVLISSMLQKMGMDAGVVMVARNMAGATTNNGHASAILRLSNGKDILVDASEPEPFARHQGLFAFNTQKAGSQYINPVFEGDTGVILYYQGQPTNAKVATAQVRTLSIPFLRSQFEYYRGERTIGGLILTPLTPKGIATEEARLQKSVRLCPQNPLAVYMLGRVSMRMGKKDAAKSQLTAANALYSHAGWVPEGMTEAFREAHR